MWYCNGCFKAMLKDIRLYSHSEEVFYVCYGHVGISVIVSLQSLHFGPPQTISRQKEFGIWRRLSFFVEKE